MKKRSFPQVPSSEITPRSTWLRRREFMAGAGAGLALSSPLVQALAAGDALKFTTASPSAGAGFHTGETLTPFADVARYNNFYEFGTDKGDPAEYAHEMSTDPWSLQVDGEVEKPGTLNLEDIQTGLG